jgi:hypothetical protein
LFVYLFIYLQRQRYITSSVACPCAAGCPWHHKRQSVTMNGCTSLDVFPC